MNWLDQQTTSQTQALLPAQQSSTFQQHRWSHPWMVINSCWLRMPTWGKHTHAFLIKVEKRVCVCLRLASADWPQVGQSVTTHEVCNCDIPWAKAMPCQFKGRTLLAQQMHIWTAMVCTSSGQMHIVTEYAASMADIWLCWHATGVAVVRASRRGVVGLKKRIIRDASRKQALTGK